MAFGSARELLEALEAGAHIDLVVTDLQMPDISGQSLIAELRNHHPDIKVLVMTMFDSAYVVQQVQSSSANGFFVKQGDQQELETALKTVLEGGQYWPAEVIENHESELATLARLTRRETEILRLIANNLSTKIIAEQLFISEETVLTHRKNLMAKLEIHSTAGLVSFALKNNMN